MSGKQILVVDDEPMVRESLELMLQLDGHEIKLAESGFEALQYFEPGKFAVVLTDNRMPGMSGVQLARQLKVLCPTQPIILFSGSPPADCGQVCDLVLLKPFTAGQLRKAVAGLADGLPTPEGCPARPPHSRG